MRHYGDYRAMLWAVAIFMALTNASSCFAQPYGVRSPANEVPCDYSYDVQIFDAVTPEPVKWCRPPNVRYVLIVGCGGGAGGSGSNTNSGKYSIYAGGPGGGAGMRETVFAGPLTQDVYSISIGAPSLGGARGNDTVFTGVDHTVTFRGGEIGQFPAGQAGQASPLAMGGGSGQHQGGGGGAGIGSGGNGGAQDHPGMGGGLCAGGGGAGLSTRVVHAGGTGGQGHLVLIPILPGEFNPKVSADRGSSGDSRR